MADGRLGHYGGDLRRTPGEHICLRLASRGNDAPISSGDRRAGWDARGADLRRACRGLLDRTGQRSAERPLQLVFSKVAVDSEDILLYGLIK